MICGATRRSPYAQPEAKQPRNMRRTGAAIVLLMAALVILENLWLLLTFPLISQYFFLAYMALKMAWKLLSLSFILAKG